jgi:hypothetical protein
MPTLRRPTSGKLMCFANEILFFELIQCVIVRSDNLDSEKWKCRLLDVQHQVS